jgi:hypothetical protein
MGSAHLEQLKDRVLASFSSEDVVTEAERRFAYTRSLGLVSDWEPLPKVVDFGRLALAIEHNFPPGGSVEIGVFKGGTSATLILSCAPESFHVAVDPYGLATQSYSPAVEEYRDWSMVRHTAQGLHQLAEGRSVTCCHYFMDSATFIRNDLLQHPYRFNVVHLDGDHSYEAVRTELAYFTGKLSGPTVYVLDDHDDHFPGVDRALRDFTAFTEIFHRTYRCSEAYGIAGFSAWLHPGRPSLKESWGEGPKRGLQPRLRRWLRARGSPT